MRSLALAVALGFAGRALAAGEPPAVAAFARAAKATLTARLKEPESARYRNLFVARAKSEGDAKQPLALCGEVNAKTSYGGYAGFQRFYVVDGESPRIDDGESVFQNFHWVYCTDKVADVAP